MRGGDGGDGRDARDGGKLHGLGNGREAMGLGRRERDAWRRLHGHGDHWHGKGGHGDGERQGRNARSLRNGCHTTRMFGSIHVIMLRLREGVGLRPAGAAHCSRRKGRERTLLDGDEGVRGT